MGAPKGGKASAGPRVKVLPRRVTGTLTEWKGHFGWVQASEAIDHPEAAKRGGKIYMAHEDVETEIAGVGAALSFFVYSDGTGLGAMNVKEATGAGAQKAIQKPTADKGKGKSAAYAKGGLATAGYAKGGFAKGGYVAKGMFNGEGKGKGRGKGKAKRPSGPDLPRERVSEAPILGEVQEWKGKYGWIKAQEEIEHPLAERREGKIYVNVKDLPEGVEELEAGGLVQFELYADESGLGAEEVQAL